MNFFEKSEWIWADGADSVNTYVRFTDTVNAKNGCSYKMYISVDTNYALYIGGKMETGQFADYAFDKVFDELDITNMLVPGENRITIDCYHQGIDTSTVREDKAGLIYSVYEDGVCVLASNCGVKTYILSGYKSGNMEYVSGQLGFTFAFNSLVPPTDAATVQAEKPLPVRLRPVRKLKIGEDEPAKLTVNGSFRESGGSSLGDRMQNAAMALKEMNVSRTLPSTDGITLTADENYDGIFAVIDTGRENAGILSLDIDVPKDCEILAGWGEHLDDLRVRAKVGGRNFCCSYYAHAGRNRFVNPFRRLGMRYLQIHIYAGKASVYYAGIKTTDYPVDREYAFRCADSMHTKIDEIARRTLRMCMHEHYEDCPWREQALYAMDSRNQMLCGYYSFREYDFAKASIRLIAQSIRDDNMLELCSPARVSITIPSFSAIFLTQVYEYVEYSGDTAFGLEMLPYMKRVAGEFIRRMKNGMIECFREYKYWNFYEWQTHLDGSTWEDVDDEKMTFDAPLCAFVSFGLRSLSALLTKLGMNDEARYYNTKHAELNKAINDNFWNEEEGAYASFLNRKGELSVYAELTNALIVYSGAAEGERLRRTNEALMSGKLSPITLSHCIFKYEALMKDENNARYVFSDIERQWSKMVTKDATTFWEIIDGAPAFDNAGSLCHGWSAIPVFFYHKYAAKMDGVKTGLYECRVEEIK